MKIYEVRKTQTERKSRVSLSVFTNEQPTLSDGRTRIYIDYHRIVNHEAKSLCGVQKSDSH